MCVCVVVCVCVFVCVCVCVCLSVSEHIQPTRWTDFESVFAEWLLTALTRTLLKSVSFGQRSRSLWRKLYVKMIRKYSLETGFESALNVFKTASKSMYIAVRSAFCSQIDWQTDIHTLTDRQTNRNKNITPPPFHGSVKNRIFYTSILCLFHPLQKGL